jgi:hypothetical protein
MVLDIISGKNAMKNKVTQIERARIIKRTLGVPVAARYLKNRNWTIEASLFILAGR